MSHEVIITLSWLIGVFGLFLDAKLSIKNSGKFSKTEAILVGITLGFGAYLTMGAYLLQK